MSDESVKEALRSNERRVVIDAPAGCGKTFQAADYAHDLAATVGPGRLLILTHTHAACGVVADRTRQARRVEIRTIDSLITEIAAAYHRVLGLPPDPSIWARARPHGFEELAAYVAKLFQRAAIVARAIASRYPVIVCDEHQDSTADQHSIVLAIHDAGAQLRVFADPMQRIYSRTPAERTAEASRWATLQHGARVEALDRPHRWEHTNPVLGAWTLRARETLRAGGRLNLNDARANGVTVVIAENEAVRHGQYQLSKAVRQPIDAFVKAQSLLVLAGQNDSVAGLHAFFNRRIPIWEGYVRNDLGTLLARVRSGQGSATAMTEALIKFMGGVGVGFSPSTFGNALLEEVATRCEKTRRGKPATLQRLARLLLEAPDHKGIGRTLRLIEQLKKSDSAFASIHIGHHREFWDAVRLADFNDPDDGLTELTRRRAHIRPPAPAAAISTIHKAKGLQCESVVVMPCDAKHFKDSATARCLLYVAITRATHRLMLVVSRDSASPLFEFA